MKNYKQILEAINRGIQLALDDFDDEEEVQNNIKSKQINHRDYTKEYLDLMDLLTIAVDLGLPSGTLWCKYNLGCNFDKLNASPENTKPINWYGGHYAWGEIKQKREYAEKTYKWKLKPKESGGKRIDSIYNSNLSTLQPQDDVAYQTLNMHNFKFHIPTKKQFEELIQYTDNYQIADYKNIPGLNGTIFIGKNGNELFLPNAGYYNDKSRFKLSYDGKYGDYWTSSLYIFNEVDDTYEVYDAAYFAEIGNTLSLGFSQPPEIKHWDRYNGMSIRAVVDKENG